MNRDLQIYFEQPSNFASILSAVRNVVLDCGLIEEEKWKSPCYTFEGKNIVILGLFKDNCVLSFFKGALLCDAFGILEKAGENSQAGRVIRFRTWADFQRVEPYLKAYVFEAIEVEKAGLKPSPISAQALEIPHEFQAVFDTDPEYQGAFNALSIGRRRAYAMFVSAAKGEQTRFSRIAKFRQRILDGYGMNDCTCGLSRKMPGCDGSHKTLKQD